MTNLTKNSPIVALVGGIASGKTTVGEVFKEDGFQVFELSDIIKDHLIREGVVAPSRDDYFKAGNALCSQHGDDYLMQEMLATRLQPVISSTPKILISGPRRPDEINFLRNTFPKAVVVGINLNVQQRIDRVLERKRAIDPIDVEAIMAHMNREWRDEDVHGCRLESVMTLCDHYVDTTAPIEETSKNVRRLIKEISGR